MSSITWQQIGEQAHLTALETAAESWDSYIGKIQEQAEAIAGDVSGTISEDSFGDETGDACRAQLSTIAGSLEDHLSEAAEKIKTALRDAHDGLSQCHDDMQELIGEVLDAKYMIENDEVDLSDARLEEIADEVRAANLEGANITTEVQEKVDEERASKADPMTERLTAIVEAARGHDDDAVAALGSVGAGRVQSPPPIGADWHGEVVQYWVDGATDLLAGGSDGVLSPEELDEFNELVAEHSGNPHFSTALMEKLGPDGLMTGVANVVQDIDRGEATFSLGQLSAMYESVGLALSTATDPTNEPHLDREWTADLMNLGAGTAHTGEGLPAGSGYQVLGPALEHGVYHEDFLVPVTEHLLALDSTTDWNLTYGTPSSCIGLNPLNYALEALDHSPAAALNLFTEGGIGLEDIEGVDLTGVTPVADPYDYLMRWSEFPHPEAPIDPNLVGDALESAATGSSTDPDYAAAERQVPTEEMVDFTERLIADAVVDPGRFATGGLTDMLDNLAGITTHYLDDFHRAEASEDVDWMVDWEGAGLSFQDVSEQMPSGEDRDPVNNWLWMIGHSEVAMAEVWGASEALMYQQLEQSQIHHDGQSGIGYEQAFEMHGRLAGDLTVGAMDAASVGVFQEAADRDKVVDSASTGAKFVIGVGTGFTPLGPVGGAVAGEASGRVIDFGAGFAKVSGEELYRDLESAVGEEVSEFQERMNETGSVDRLAEFLADDPTLGPDDLDALPADYYERYWDTVDNYESQYTDREPIQRGG